MKFSRYCIDKALEITIYFFLIIVTVIFLGLADVSMTMIIFLVVLWTVSAIGLFLHDFFRRHRFYKEVFSQLELLEQKYFLSEMIEPGRFSESELVCELLRDTNRSMREQVNVFKKMQEEYREYIEMWVHEVKTPIASSRLIIQNHPDPVTKSLEEELEHIEEYVEQVLYYSRSNNVEKDYLIRPMMLKDAVFPVVKKHYRDFNSKKIVLSVENLELEVFSDTKWLEFIMNQIVTNAIKYSKEERAYIQIIASEGKENTILTIEDNGIGISIKDQKRVFEKGFTGQNGRKFAKSTGMGLYICKKLCDKMGLSLSLQSEEGKGTKVSIIFPRNKMILLES